MEKEQDIYFSDPRLGMTVIGRLSVRLATYVGYALLVVVAVLALTGDVRWLQAVGALIALFLLDRIGHSRQSEKNLVKLPRGRVNVADYMTSASFGAIEWAFDRAVLAGGNFPLYVASRLVQRRDVREALIRMDIQPTDVAGQIETILRNRLEKKYSKDQILLQVQLLLKNSLISARQVGDTRIDPVDIFAALGSIGEESVNKVLAMFAIDPGDLRSALIFSSGAPSALKRLPRSPVGLLGKPHKTRHRIMNRSWTARPTPYLDQFSEDLTDFARFEKVGLLIGHANEYDRLEDILARSARPNVLLIGDPGSGKDTLMGHLAFEMSKDRVPSPLFDKRLIRMEIGGLVAGVSQAEAQARVKKIIDEIVRAGNIILYLPDIHNLLKTTGGQGVSAADILIPAIKANAFSVIGATSPQEYKQSIEPGGDFAGVFETIKIQEISEAEAVQFLVYDSILLERQYKIIISFSAVKQAVLLAKKYFRQKLLPASAEDLLKETLADVAEKKRKILTGEDVIAVAEKKVNVPIHRAGKAEAEGLLNLEATIHKRLIDQEEAVGAVARALREYRSGLSRKGGPIATFLFVGPTGVGKTELSKILAKIQFGSSEMMARLDMSEYQDKSTVSRLLENLTDTIRQKPYSLILLDEFEKAHPDILNLFLQVFDDGRLTDSAGRTVDFQNTIIIATSNANSDFIKTEIEKGTPVKDLSEQVKKKLTGYFKPELLNRFSGIIVFKPLSPADILAIARIQLAEVADTLRQSQGIELQFEEKAVAEIARIGFDPVFGARPLRAVISEKIRAVLAEKILRGEVARGGAIKVVLRNNNFEFQ